MRNILPLVLIGSVLGATAIGSADDFVIEPLPSSAHPAFRNHFAKYVDVMGVAVYATSNSGNNKVLHCARTLAQYLDNDEHGEADDPAVLARMVADGASMVMWRTFDDAEDSDFWEDVPDSIADSCQDLMAEETIPDWETQQEFDASLEECFHLVNFVGLARVYPEVFQEQNRIFHSTLSKAARSVVLQVFVESLSSVADGVAGGVTYTARRYVAAAHAHTRIIEALRAHDGDLAEKMMRDHLDEADAYWHKRHKNLVSRPVVWRR